MTNAENVNERIMKAGKTLLKKMNILYTLHTRTQTQTQAHTHIYFFFLFVWCPVRF